MSRQFLISSLLQAGFGQPDPMQATLTRATTTTDPNQGRMFQVFRQDHLYTLAGHSSHRSHSSHSSHRSGSGGHSSHYSHTSSTGGYSLPSYSPPPSYSPAPSRPPATLYTSPSEAGAPPASGALKPLQGRSALFKTVVMHVQVALMGRGLYDGPIDGTVGPALRAALRQFQQGQGIEVTGTITPPTLDALHVPSS